MSDRNGDKNISGRYLLGIFVALVTIILALGAFRSCIAGTESIKPIPVTITYTSTPLLSTTMVDSLTMNSTITELLCNDQGEVETVFYEILTSGGESPYIYEVELSKEKNLGPFIRYENESMLFQVDGGKSFTLVVRSFDDKQLKRIISAPTTDRKCKKTEDALGGTPTVSGTPATSTVATTLTLTAAANIFPTTVTPTPSGTTTSTSLTTTTATPSGTATSKSSSTTTPTPSRTATTVSTSTDTSTPSSTATTISLKTATPTATPTPTSTIIPNPNLKECEDGIDNDGDNLIDYPADPQCTSSKDNKEKQ